MTRCPRRLRSGTRTSTADCACGATELGARVLDGDQDAVELLGIDRWVGGTHLVPGAVRRWDGAALVAPFA